MKRRIEYFDYLRILAMLAVIILHVTAGNYYIVGIDTYEWQVLNFYNSCVRWAVPVFVMISGALFLSGKDVSIEKLYKKNIFRMIIAFIFWSCIYAINKKIANGGDVKSLLEDILMGHYHMWFLFMIVGLYMIVPFLRKIIESEVLTKYFLILSFVFTILIPYICVFISLYSNRMLNIINTNVGNMYFHLPIGFAGYFILGFCLNKKEINKRTRGIIYVIGLIGFLATMALTYWISNVNGTATVDFLRNFTVNVMLEAMLVFVFAKQNLNNLKLNINVKIVISKLAKYSFGAYLVHVLIIDKLASNGIYAVAYNPLISVPIISLIVFVISFVISILLSKIPIIGKYVV